MTRRQQRAELAESAKRAAKLAGIYGYANRAADRLAPHEAQATDPADPEPQ